MRNFADLILAERQSRLLDELPSAGKLAVGAPLFPKRRAALAVRPDACHAGYRNPLDGKIVRPEVR